MPIEFDYNLYELQQKFGERPGGYRVDPYYFRQGASKDKALFWNHYNKKWERVKPHEKFDLDMEGIVVRVD